MEIRGLHCYEDQRTWNKLRWDLSMQDYQYVSQLLFYHSALLEQMIYNNTVRNKRSALQRQS